MLHIVVLAKGGVNEHGEREVFFELNGQMRTMLVRDHEAMKVFHQLCSKQGLSLIHI